MRIGRKYSCDTFFLRLMLFFSIFFAVKWLVWYWEGEDWLAAGAAPQLLQPHQLPPPHPQPKQRVQVQVQIMPRFFSRGILCRILRICFFFSFSIGSLYFHDHDHMQDEESEGGLHECEWTARTLQKLHEPDSRQI